jgi:hypothetical protein
MRRKDRDRERERERERKTQTGTGGAPLDGYCSESTARSLVPFSPPLRAPAPVPTAISPPSPRVLVGFKWSVLPSIVSEITGRAQ